MSAFYRPWQRVLRRIRDPLQEPDSGQAGKWGASASGPSR